MEVRKSHIPVNRYSRPGMPSRQILGIGWHWTASPGASADGIGRYFATLKNQRPGPGVKLRYASTQYGVDAVEAVEYMPGGIHGPSEIAYSVGGVYRPGVVERFGSWPNASTVNIEICHPDWSGVPEPVTIDRLLDLTSLLLTTHGLTPDAVFRHYDITGKICPRWAVEDPALYKRLVKQLWKL